MASRYPSRWIDAICTRAAVRKGIEMPPTRINLNNDDKPKAKEFVEQARKLVETDRFGNTEKQS